jgi:RNA polymerase sigma factor (sigma-70 family)
MTPDSELLRRFAKTNSEDAFAELVKRHVNLVYSAALRQMNGDEHLAKDVAQMVFTDLARKAGSLSRREILTGWLYTSAHFAAAKIVRTENRRRDREEKFMREPTSETAPETDWEKLRPMLDDVMHELKESDREAVLLRYFENQQFAEVGAKLGLNENAARMRVERALEKLRDTFTKRGITTATALASVISANAIQIAPANLAATLTTASIATVGTGTFTLLNIMTATKFKLGISALIVAGAATAFVIQHQAQEKLRAENGALTQQIAQLQADNETLPNRLAVAGDSKSLSDEQMNELLKLRGEVTRLKKESDDATLAARNAVADEVQALQKLGNLPPIKTYVSTAFLRISWNEAIVTGGWKTPSGRRAFVFATVESGQDNQLTISSKVLEFTDEADARLGLNEFNIDDQTQTHIKPNKISAEQYEAISMAAQNSDGVETLATPSVLLASGNSAQVVSIETHSTPSGEKYSTGPVIDFIPTISEDGQSVKMVMVAQLNLSTHLPPNQ